MVTKYVFPVLLVVFALFLSVKGESYEDSSGTAEEVILPEGSDYSEDDYSYLYEAGSSMETEEYDYSESEDKVDTSDYSYSDYEDNREIKDDRESTKAPKDKETRTTALAEKAISTTARAESLISTTAWSEGLTSTTARSEGLTSTTARSEGLTSTTARSEGLTSITARSDGLTSTTARSEGLTSTTARAEGLISTTARAAELSSTTARAGQSNSTTTPADEKSTTSKPDDKEKDSRGRRWALLVAGSKGWRNYVDQANVCHAYKLLRAHGIREEQIITIMYDDIADHVKNPNRGVIRNKPNGTNVYKGVKIDYKGKDVNSNIFLKVLRGNKAAVAGKGSGRVINSKSKDKIFVYFSGQGVPGALNFPHSLLYSRRLISVLKNMAKSRKFAKMVWYVDAPYSGSMFENLLPTDLNIMAVTATNPKETAYKCYRDSTVGVSLGSHFSINWMHDVEARPDLRQALLRNQLNFVANQTNVSQISIYGDMRMQDVPLSEIMGGRITGTEEFKPCVSIVDNGSQRMSKRIGMFIGLGQTAEVQDNVSEKNQTRPSTSIVDDVLRIVAKGDKNLVKVFSSQTYELNDKNIACYEDSVRHINKHCVNIAENENFGKHLYVFMNMCSSPKTNITQIRSAVEQVCKQVF